MCVVSRKGLPGLVGAGANAGVDIFDIELLVCCWTATADGGDTLCQDCHPFRAGFIGGLTLASVSCACRALCQIAGGEWPALPQVGEQTVKRWGAFSDCFGPLGLARHSKAVPPYSLA